MVKAVVPATEETVGQLKDSREGNDVRCMPIDLTGEMGVIAHQAEAEKTYGRRRLLGNRRSQIPQVGILLFWPFENPLAVMAAPEKVEYRIRAKGEAAWNAHGHGTAIPVPRKKCRSAGPTAPVSCFAETSRFLAFPQSQ